MAKLKVKQIEDLLLTPDTLGAVRSIQIGANVIKPLTNVEVSGTGDYISGASVSGNIVTLTKAALPEITVTAAQNLPEGAVPFVRDITASGHTITKTMGAIGNGLAINADGVLNLNLAVTPAAGSTGQVISGLSYANGVLAPTYSTVAAANVTIADAGSKFTAENVEGALAELAGSIDAIDPIVTTVAAGTGISVTPSATLDAEGQPTNDVTYTVAADFTVDTKKYTAEESAEKAGKTYIRIMDGETVISETDAAAFVKDGFLQSVTEDKTNNTIKFTWNTDAGVQETTISIKDLCDVYTVGEGLVASEDGYTFSHQTGATGLDTTKSFGSGSDTDNKITVKVPSVTVDKFGHVSALTETEVSLEIPESVASAVQKVTGDDYVTATKNGTEVTLATVTGDVAAGEDKLATAQSVKTYVDGKIDDLDAEVTSADGTNVQVKVAEVDGKITAVNVTDNSINATDLTNAIEALDATVRGTSDGHVSESQTALTVEGHNGAYVAVEVVEEDGKITGVNVKENIDDTIKNAIEALDGTATIATVTNDGVVTLKAGIVQTDGTVSQGEGSDIVLNKVAFTGNAADVDVATGITGLAATNVQAALAELQGDINTINGQTITAKENQAVEVTTAENGNTTIGLKLVDGEHILSQTAAGLKTTLDLTYDSDAKEIRLWGISDETPIATVSAADFIKDGMLAGAEYVELTEGQVEGQTAGKYIHLTFNTDAGKDEIYVNVTALVDTYTAKANDWIVLDTTKKEFSHKTQDNVVAGTYGSKTNEGQFSFPKVTVDAAGHVTEISTESISVATTVYVPKREDFTVGESLSNIVTLTKGTPDVDSGVDVYLNGQLLAAEICTVNAEAKTVTIAPYSISDDITLEANDIIMVRYFVKETAAPIVNA